MVCKSPRAGLKRQVKKQIALAYRDLVRPELATAGGTHPPPRFFSALLTRVYSSYRRW
jgi:hypothetical protein